MTIACGHINCYDYDHDYMTRVNYLMQQVSKSQFKAKALEMFRQVESTGEPVVITDHGKPSVEVRPYRNKEVDPLTLLQGSVIEFSDPLEPIAEDEWEALA